MKVEPVRPLIAAILLVLCWACGTTETPVTEKAAPAAAVTSQEIPLAPQATQGALGRLPLAFEENQGQYDPRALFVARHATGTFFFGPDAVSAAFVRRVKQDQPGGEVEVTENFALKILFLDTREDVVLDGELPLQGKVSHFKGKDPEKWVSSAATFGRLVYHGLWPGIDLAWSGSEGRLRSEYRLARAGDIGLIRLRYKGQDSLRIDEQGRLVISTPWGDLYEEPPRAHQNHRPVEVTYSLEEATGEVSFRLGSADPDAPLTINP